MEPAAGTIINAVFRAHGHEAQLRTYPSIGDRYRIEADLTPLVPPELISAGPFAKQLEARIARRLAKVCSVIDYIGYRMMTTEDLVVEGGRDPEEVLSSRDYREEYEAMMEIICWARRALDLPDVIAEPLDFEE